ncbi:MAG TPA: PaaI family thioesterase [Bryobacteraceae bacterium]|nr:PaaI family thioesterase [Bryobacteraceae bacterium]
MTFEQLKQFLQEIPFNAHVGLRLTRLHKDGVTITCEMRPELRNGSGVLHGGVTATLADVAVGMALARHLGRLRSVTTVEMKVNYLRPVEHGRITARSHLVKVGSRLCCGRVEIFDNQKRPVAAALITYMILER